MPKSIAGLRERDQTSINWASTDASANTIGFFRLPPGHGERRGKQFGLFSLGATSPELG